MFFRKRNLKMYIFSGIVYFLRLLRNRVRSLYRRGVNETFGKRGGNSRCKCAANKRKNQNKPIVMIPINAKCVQLIELHAFAYCLLCICWVALFHLLEIHERSL